MEPNMLQGPLFIMFENKSNSCWLNSSMIIIAHNKAIKRIASSYPDSKISEIISAYEEATFILNNPSCSLESRLKETREVLFNIQIIILQYLQPRLKYKDGEPDSAFCALLNLINENKHIKEHLSFKWLWEKKKCDNCGSSAKSDLIIKPIITLSRVNTFKPDSPTFIFTCLCKKDQEMKLIYKELPPCLIFHFENGAGYNHEFPLFFTVQDRKYHLTGIIILEKNKDASLNHFVTWIRDPSTNKWLECNDLNNNIVSFSSELPQFALNDVYMCIFESSDKRGKIVNEACTEHVPKQSVEAAEVIELSDDDSAEFKSVLKSTGYDEPVSSENSKTVKRDLEIRELIKHDVETTFAAFMEHILLKKEHKP